MLDDDDQPRFERGRRFGDGIDGRVGAEEEDPPAVRAEEEAERDQSDVVLFAGGAGENDERAAAAAPEARQREQPPADDRGGEVLLSDVEPATLPFVPDPAQHREDQLPQDGLEREPRERLVEDRMDGTLVVCVRGGQEAPARVFEPGLLRAHRLEDTACCLGSGEPFREGAFHLLDALRILARVEAKASLGADRLEEPVTALPGSEELRIHADAPRELADPKSSGRS